MWILQNNIQINLENFWLDRLWHFKLSTVAVTQTGHFSLSHTALLVLLEHQSYGLFPLSMKKKINGGFLSNFPWQYFVSCGVFVSWVVTNKAYLIETSIHYLKVLVIKGGGGRNKRSFLLEISQAPFRYRVAPAMWNEIRLNVFDALSVIKVCFYGGKRRSRWLLFGRVA